MLGPLLFLIYINDLGGCCPGADMVLFADDTTVLKSATSKEQIEITTKETLSIVTEWLVNNKVTNLI